MQNSCCNTVIKCLLNIWLYYCLNIWSDCSFIYFIMKRRWFLCSLKKSWGAYYSLCFVHLSIRPSVRPSFIRTSSQQQLAWIQWNCMGSLTNKIRIKLKCILSTHSISKIFTKFASRSYHFFFALRSFPFIRLFKISCCMVRS